MCILNKEKYHYKYKLSQGKISLLLHYSQNNNNNNNNKSMLNRTKCSNMHSIAVHFSSLVY